MRRNCRRLLSIMLSGVMCILLLPTTALAAIDTRTMLTTLTATSNIEDIAVFGARMNKVDFVKTEESPIEFANSMNGYWRKKDSNNNYVTAQGDSFTEGTYRYEIQVRIDNDTPEGMNYGSTYTFDNGFVATIDGVQWKNGTITRKETYSCLSVSSPDIVISAPAGTPLEFVDYDTYDIPKSYQNEAIATVEVAGSVYGGTKPYVFTKKSGPSWINVSTDGKITGTPTNVQGNSDLVVKVTDANNASKEITIKVDKTLVNPENRIPVSSVVATSNITDVVKYEASIYGNINFNVTTGAPAGFLSNSGDWLKKDGSGAFVRYTSSTFTEGTYKYEIQVRVEGDAGETHVLDEAATVKVDGSFWNLSGQVYQNKTYSFGRYTSPEFTVTKPNDYDTGLAISSSTFPDDNFRKYIIDNFDTNKSGYLGQEEIAAATSIYLVRPSESQQISDLTGINYFTNLTSIVLAGNSLTNIDLSENKALTVLNVNGNDLETLNLQANTALKTLYCNNNNLESLNLSKNTQLKLLDCSENAIQALDLSTNKALEDLNCSGNELKTLDVSKNTKLGSIDCSNNKLLYFDFSSLSSVTYVCANNNVNAIQTYVDNTYDLSKLEGLDVSKVISWEGASVSGNKLLVTPGTTTVYYTYKCGTIYNDVVETFALEVTHGDRPSSEREEGTGYLVAISDEDNGVGRLMDHNGNLAGYYTVDKKHASIGDTLTIKLYPFAGYISGYAGISVAGSVHKGTKVDDNTFQATVDQSWIYDNKITVFAAVYKNSPVSYTSNIDLSHVKEFSVTSSFADDEHTKIYEGEEVVVYIEFDEDYEVYSFDITDADSDSVSYYVSNGHNSKYYHFYMPNKAITLNAEIVKSYVDVKYNSNGRGVAPAAVNAKSGLLLTQPKAPTAANYCFIGWYKTKAAADSLDESQKWDFANDVPKEDITLYAGWAKTDDVQYVKFVVLDGQGNTNYENNILLKSNKQLTNVPTNPSMFGYNFGGWYTAKTGGVQTTVSENAIFTSGTVLYSRWDAIAYPVKYYSANSSGTEGYFYVNGAVVGTYTADKKQAKIGDVITVTTTSSNGYCCESAGWINNLNYYAGTFVSKEGTTEKWKIVVTADMICDDNIKVFAEFARDNKNAVAINYDKNACTSAYLNMNGLIPEGESVVLYVTTNEGYSISDIKLRDTDNKTYTIQYVSKSGYTEEWVFTMPAKACTVEVTTVANENRGGIYEGEGGAKYLYNNNAVVDYTGMYYYATDRNTYYLVHGKVITGWKQLSDKWYYFGTDGAMKTSWQKINGKWYYFETSGIMVSGWKQISGKWYYFEASGAMISGWKQISGKWYYFEASGAMVSGWKQISGKWYYFETSGAMVSGWKQISGKWYYFEASGAMVSGWKQISGKWYYFETSGSMATGWKQISSKWYYFNSSGAMVTGTQTISGKTYTFNSNGVWIK